MVNRRRVVRFIKARRGLPQPTYPGRTPATPADNVLNAPASAPTAPPTRRARKRPVVKSETSTAVTDDSTPIRDNNGESSVASTIAVGKAAVRKKSTRTTSRQAKPRSAPVIPLDDDSNSSDDEQNERLQRAVALKARKEAAVAGESSSQASTLKSALKQRAPVKLRASPTKFDALFGAQEFEDTGMTPTQLQQNLMQADKNRSRHARKSAPSTGRQFTANNTQDEYQDDEEPRSRKKPKKSKVTFVKKPRKKQVPSDGTSLDGFDATINELPDGLLDDYMPANPIPDAPSDESMPPAPMMPSTLR